MTVFTAKLMSAFMHYTADRADTGSIVLNVGIGYRPCQFLDI